MDNKQKMDKWTGCFAVGLIVTIIDFFIMINQEDASSGAKVTAIILICGIIFCIVSVVQINIYNAKAKNMSADEYLSDRFANAIPETKEVFGIKDKNTSFEDACKVLGTNNAALITSMGKQYADDYANWLDLLDKKKKAYNEFVKAYNQATDTEDSFNENTVLFTE